MYIIESFRLKKGEPMSTDFDVIIVGGGPAGACAALFASKLGLSVLLLDKAKFPRDKSCGGALSSAGVQVLGELGLLPRLLQTPHMPVNQISFFSPLGPSVTVPMLKVDEELPVTAMVCRRVVLDDFLFQAAAEVVKAHDWRPVRDVLIEDGQAVGVRVEKVGQRERVYTAKIVLGADGARSLVARRMGVRHYPEYQSVAVQSDFRYVTGMQGSLEVHFLDDTLPGYCWVYPTESGETNVGVSLPLDRALHAKMDLRRVLRNAIESPQLRERFEFAEPTEFVHKPKLTILPVGNTLRKIHGDGFMLLGDAAGLINPCSSEGVAAALLSGKIAAETAASAIAEGDCSRHKLEPYSRKLWNALGPGLKMADRLLDLRTPKAINSLIKSAARRPHNAGWISCVLLGTAPPSQDLDDFLRYLHFFGK